MNASKPGRQSQQACTSVLHLSAGHVQRCSQVRHDCCPLLCAGGEQYLWYKAPKKIDVAILRATTADVDGNVTFEKEAMVLDCQNQARHATAHTTTDY